VLKIIGFLVALLPLPLFPASVNLSASVAHFPPCFAMASGSPIASVTIDSVCTVSTATTITASEVPFSAKLSTSGFYGDIGSGGGEASGTYAGLILGGSGSGFINITVTNTIDLSEAFFGHAIASAGNLEFNGKLSSDTPTILTSTYGSGFIPFTFGQIIITGASVSLSFDLEQSDWFANLSSVVTFDIRDENMNPVPGAFVQPTTLPEPSSAWLAIPGLALVAGLRRFGFSRYRTE
jgi:hypothetical protein